MQGDPFDSVQTNNAPMIVAETLTSKLSEFSEISNSYDDDDCVIVDVTPASIICLDDGESEMNFNGSNIDENNTISNERSNNNIHNSLDSISSICDSVFNNNPDDTNSLFVVDPKPGFNGSKIPLYHSITGCAQSTPIRNGSDTNQKNIIIQSYDLENKTVTVTPKNSRKNQSDSDVILIHDEGENVSSLHTQNTNMDESVIFCGIQMAKTPIRRIETTTPSPNKKRILSLVKIDRIECTRNRNRRKANHSGSNADTIIETLQKSLHSPSDKRIVIIDGCNIAFGHGNNKKFSAEGIQIALRYFERKGHETKVVIPQFRLRIQQSTNQALMHQLQNSDKLVVTPSKNLPGKMSSSYDDRFILQLAEEFDAAIISNDNYRDLLLENPAWKKIIETRVIGYTWLKDFFMVPTDPYGKSGPKLDEILNKKV